MNREQWVKRKIERTLTFRRLQHNKGKYTPKWVRVNDRHFKMKPRDKCDKYVNKGFLVSENKVVMTARRLKWHGTLNA